MDVRGGRNLLARGNSKILGAVPGSVCWGARVRVWCGVVCMSMRVCVRVWEWMTEFPYGLKSWDASAGGGEPVLCGHMKVQLNKELCCSFLYELMPFFWRGTGEGGRCTLLTLLLIFEVCIRLSVKMVCWYAAPFFDITGCHVAVGWHPKALWNFFLLPSDTSRDVRCTDCVICLYFPMESIHPKSPSALHYSSLFMCPTLRCWRITVPDLHCQPPPLPREPPAQKFLIRQFWTSQTPSEWFYNKSVLFSGVCYLTCLLPRWFYWFGYWVEGGD